MNQFNVISHSILSQAKKNDFAGYDPFDGLNSKFLRPFPKLRQGIFGLAWIQFHKRSAINFRPLCLVQPARNPKGIGLFILGLVEDFKRTQDQQFLHTAQSLADWLLTQQSDQQTWKHACWGYHFDWNARAFFVPKGKPNVITTIYVAQALYALGKVTKVQKYIDVAFDCAHFIVKKLYTETENRAFIAYIPGEIAFVHNASLWGAAWVAFVASQTNNQAYQQLALKVAQQSVSEQRADGAWVYGARHHHQFIDGFHTGYNLEALDMIRRSLNTQAFDQAIDLGLDYYKRELITTDGTAKYYHDNQYPLDMHCVAQAVITLVKVSGSDPDRALATKILQQATTMLYMPNKQRFVYQKYQYLTNKINYMRWTQAWVYYAFSLYNRTQENNNEKN